MQRRARRGPPHPKARSIDVAFPKMVQDSRRRKIRLYSGREIGERVLREVEARFRHLRTCHVRYQERKRRFEALKGRCAIASSGRELQWNRRGAEKVQMACVQFGVLRLHVVGLRADEPSRNGWIVSEGLVEARWRVCFELFDACLGVILDKLHGDEASLRAIATLCRPREEQAIRWSKHGTHVTGTSIQFLVVRFPAPPPPHPLQTFLSRDHACARANSSTSHGVETAPATGTRRAKCVYPTCHRTP
jgi:hypothetical protein